MGGAERRRHTRMRCSFPCDLVINGGTVTGEVRNVSAGGLGVITEAEALEQGDPIGVVLRIPGSKPLAIPALVWHVRASRRRESGKVTRSWGLVLGDASPGFAQLVAAMQKARGPSRRTLPPRMAPPPASAAPPPARQDAPAALAAPAAPVREEMSAPTPLPETPRLPTPEETLAPSPPPEASTPTQFAIRIQQVGRPRTCRVVASGATAEEAMAAALAEVGPGWNAIEVRPLP